jgi:DNA polymerase III delta prime subunit
MWTEKHRPNAPEFVVGDAKKKILPLLENPTSMPHLLFHSSAPGTGKTSMAKAIAEELGSDFLQLNTSDDRKIEVVRARVKQFARTQSLDGKRKIILMDEIDGMLKASQEALRGIMEQYAKSVLFILTCNKLTAVHEAVQNRCLAINFAYPKKEDIKEYLIKICVMEKLEYTDAGMNALIDMKYPSIRGMVLLLQGLKAIGKDVNGEHLQKSCGLYDTIFDFIKNKDYMSIKELVFKQNLNARQINYFVWEKFVAEGNLKGIQLCGRNERDMALGADDKVVFVTSLIELVK